MEKLLTLKFGSVEKTSPIDLSIFLQFFVIAYRACSMKLDEPGWHDNFSKICDDGIFEYLDYNEIIKCMDNKEQGSDPQIVSIKQQSPIEIVLVGGLGLWFVSSVLSGGKQKIEIGPLKLEFNLKSIGDSIADLRRALTNNPVLQIGNGFRGSKIKLNKDEYTYLFKNVNKNGGFQRYLGELQLRINHKTKELELSNRDIEKILNYKKNPSKGGFQYRFNRIFSRHFY